MGIVAENAGKSLGSPPTRILSDISFEIKDGEFVSLTGRSGSGKSSLLYLLSSLDVATQGVVEVDGRNLATMKKEELGRFRNEKVGFIFQFHYLLSELTAIENVLMPARKTRQESNRRDYALALLDQFGLGEKRDRFPRQLSGGELQRLAIARSLIMNPKYIFADEPTGSLDSVNSDIVIQLLRRSNKERGTTLILVTHDPDIARMADRQIHLVDGRIV